MRTPYATLDHVYNLGLSAQAFVARAHAVAAADVDISTGRIRYKGHGYSPLDRISFEVTSGGALPAALSGFAFNYTSPIPLGFDLFQVATVLGGSTPITPFATTGSGWAIALDPARRLNMNLSAAADRIDEKITAHNPPLLPDAVTGEYPGIIVEMNALMAALATVTTLQFENAEARVAVDRLVKREADAQVTLATWLAGKPLNMRPTDGTNYPDNAAQSTSSRDAAGWSTGML